MYDKPASSGRPTNTGARVVDELMFQDLVDAEIRKAQRLRYTVSLVCLAAQYPPVGRQTLVAEIVTGCVRCTDVVMPWVSASVALLLIDADTPHLSSILTRLTARLGAVAWSAGGSCYPRTTTNADGLLRQAVDLMVQARKDGGNRLYVAS